MNLNKVNHLSTLCIDICLGENYGTFETTNLGELTYFLQMQFVEVCNGVTINQNKHGLYVLKRYDNQISTPKEVSLKLDRNYIEEFFDSTLFKQMVSFSRYLCKSRHDIVFAEGVISRFMSEPRSSHSFVAKRVVTYIKETLEYGVLFLTKVKQNYMRQIVFSDADWCGDKLDNKRT